MRWWEGGFGGLTAWMLFIFWFDRWLVGSVREVSVCGTTLPRKMTAFAGKLQNWTKLHQNSSTLHVSSITTFLRNT